MHLDPWTLALQTINVLVLVWLLAHFLFRPVAAIIAARRAASDALMTDAERPKPPHWRGSARSSPMTETASPLPHVPRPKPNARPYCGRQTMLRPNFAQKRSRRSRVTSRPCANRLSMTLQILR